MPSSRQVLVNNSDSSADFGIVEGFWFTQTSPCRLLCKTRLADNLSSLSQFNFLVVQTGRQKASAAVG